MAEAATTTKFPSHFVDPATKNSEKWCKQYAEALHTEGSNLPESFPFSRKNKSAGRMRSYGRGEQSQLQYKELMGLKKMAKADPNTSFRNINFEILKVAPKIRNVLVNKMVNQPLNMTCKPIDPKSLSERRAYKAKVLEFMINKEAIKQFERLSKLSIEKPVAEGEEAPANMSEVDPYVDMNPKDITSMEVLDFLTMSLDENNWEQLGQEIAGDLVDVGVGGTTQYIDVDNKIKTRRIFPENCVTNKCVFPDFRDLIRFGEYISITVSELKRKTRNKWKEEVYQQIASKVAGNEMKYTGMPSDHYNGDTGSYAYDHENVRVLECLWLSTDTETHVEFMNEAGNRRVKKESFNYKPFRGDVSVNGGKGMSDAEYTEYNNGAKKILRTELQNVYTCSWIVGTDFVYNHGLMKNMMRSVNNWQQCVLPVVLISTNFQSTMAVIEQPLDQVQLNYLQFQSHVAGSRPPGIAIEKRALARIGKGTSKKWDPKEDLELFAETGNFVYDGYDEHGNPLLQYPFKDLPNGLSPGAGEHFQLMMQFIELIRSMVGLNQMTEGNTPPERLGKTVAQLSFGATDNALSHLTMAYRTIYQRTSRNLFYLLQNNIHRMDPDQLSESLGMESHKYFMLNKDLSLRDMGIILEEGPDDAIREKISALLNLMVTNKEIPGEEAIKIEMQKNIYRQLQMLRKHRLEKEQRDLQSQQATIEQQGQINQQTAIALDESKQKGADEEFQRRMQEKEVDAMLAERMKAAEQAHEVVLQQMVNAQDDKELQQKIAADYVKAKLHETAELTKVRETVEGKLAQQKLANKRPSSSK